MLVRCIYASRALGEPDSRLLDSILEQSRKRNPALGVTGLLCASKEYFIQVLEGGREEVNKLYRAIVRDDRHKQVTILSYEEIAERRFANWTMGQVDLSRVNPGVLLRYLTRPELNPFDCSGSTILALLQDLAATAAIVNRGE